MCTPSASRFVPVFLLSLFILAGFGATTLTAQPYRPGSSVPNGLDPADWQAILAAHQTQIAATGSFGQQAYLKPGAFGTTQATDRFGGTVAISGNTVVIGADGEDSGTTGINSVADETTSNSGAAFVYVRNGSTWTQQAYLKPAAVGTTQALDRFGWGVAISGDTIVVGAPFEDSSSTGIDSAADEMASNAGAAYIFVRSGSTWTQQAYLKPAAVGTTGEEDGFGWSVAISGDTVAVGAIEEDSGTTGVNTVANENGLNSGAVYVFVRNGSTWSQQAYLKPAAVGATQEEDLFGWAVALSGNTIVAGAPDEDSATTGIDSTANEDAIDAGAAYVFFRIGSTWSQQAYLKPAAIGTTQQGDEFGASVDVSGDTVAVGAYREDSGTSDVNSGADESATDSGAAFIFTRTGSTWSQQAYLKPAAFGTTQADDQYGWTVALSGNMAVVASTGEDSGTAGVDSAADETAGDAGAAYVYVRNGSTWSQQAYLKPAAFGTTQAGDVFGTHVAISDGLLVVGAYREDSNSTGVNSTPDELSNNAGAAYIFEAALFADGFETGTTARWSATVN